MIRLPELRSSFYIFPLVLLFMFNGHTLDSTLAQEPVNVRYRVEFLYGVPFVTSMVWADDGRMFFTEKMGTVQVVSADGVLQEDPVVEINIRTFNEDGLLSIVLDPDFSENSYFYVYYTDADPDLDDPENELRNLVVRYEEVDGAGTNPTIMLDIPVADSGQYQHNGGRMRFDEQGYLYLSIGDLNHYNVFGQEMDRVESKIHRFVVEDETLVPAPGNPFGDDNSVWAYGLRNVFSFVFDPFSDEIFATENGPACDDEINRIVPGENYGWGIVALASADEYEGYCDRPERHEGAVEPLVSYAPTIAPTGILIYSGEAFPQWQGHLFFCSFKQLTMWRAELNQSRTRFIGEIKPVDTSPLSNCGIEIAQGPDDYIYYSNTEGIYRLVPVP